MKRFLTIFPIAMNVHLIKDVGMISYIMHKELDYELTLLCYKNDDYSYLEKEVKGLKIVYLKRYFIINCSMYCFFSFLILENMMYYKYTN